MSNRGGGSGQPDKRPTKAERKEQARLEREAIQRKLAARTRNRRIGVAVIAIAIVAIVAVVVLLPSGSGLASPDDLLADAAAAKTQAGCDSVQEVPPFDPDSEDQTHIGPTSTVTQMPPLTDYPSQPPASGPHNPVPLAPGVYDSPPPVDQSIHSLEHAGAIVWLSPSASGEQVDQIREFYSQRIQTEDVGQAKVIVAPYDYDQPGGQLPEGAQMVLVAWHQMQTCASPNLAVAFDFTSQYSNAFPDREYIGQAPEPSGTM